MKLHFFVRFRTTPGQSIRLLYRLHGSEKGMPREASLAMDYFNAELWHVVMDSEKVDLAGAHEIYYQYQLIQDQSESIREGVMDRVINLQEGRDQDIHLYDTWNHAGEYENVFVNAPFRNVLLKKRKHRTGRKTQKACTHLFRVKAPLLREHESLCLLGNAPALGSWDSGQSIQMVWEDGWWQARLSLKPDAFPVYYKYGVCDKEQKRFTSYEAGKDRVLFDAGKGGQLTILHDGFAQLPNNTWKGAGVAIPVFSLRSEKSFGVGEFTDLMLLADWARKMGFRVIQLLPVNDTVSTGTFMDSYPYSAISAFALHPMYLNLDQLAGKEFQPLLRPFRKKQQELNALDDVDYVQVIAQKMEIIRLLYEALKDRVQGSEEYKQFLKQNSHWLLPYAAFSYLRDKFGTADFSKWPQHGVYEEKAIQKLYRAGTNSAEQIRFHLFVQFHLDRQLHEAHAYANKLGIILKGDIPIGVNRNGVDAWMAPELYHMDVQAGAPPDDFAVKGQNWNFPTYNWKKMAEDGFQWWRYRFEQMSNYFDAFRVDHILGFFRIWSIPVDSVEGIMGRFHPVIPIDLKEFNERGIWFDKERYCQPFINDAVLWEMFGPAEKRYKPFLEGSENGYYRLRPEFATQRLVEKHFEGQVLNEEQERLRQGLFDLISNVILFEEPGSEGGKFHFRFHMEQTMSFRHLDWHTGEQLKALYVNYFFERQDLYWKSEAMKKLPALKGTTDMLVCGEDLGLVPHCVPDVMKQLGILSLEIQRMPKDPLREFFHPADAPYLSVVTPSTHDMSTVRGWWEEERGKTQHFFNRELGQYGEAPLFCEAWINRAILLQHLYSPAQWAIFQLQDILGISEDLRRKDPAEERINIPSNPRHYWKYRMHLSLEDLNAQTEFNSELAGYISASGRNSFDA